MNPHDLMEFIIDVFEGGLGNDPYDPGGLTKYGASQRRYPDLDIANLTKEQVIQMFIKDFYNRFEAEVIPMPVRLHYVDMCITGGGVRAMQIACNHLGWVPRLKTDNALGKITKKAFKWVNTLPIRAVYLAYISGRLDHYRCIKGRPDTHYRSWMRRTSIMNMEIAQRLVPGNTPDGFFALKKLDAVPLDTRTSMEHKVVMDVDVAPVPSDVVTVPKPKRYGKEQFFLYSTVNAQSDEHNYYDGNKMKAKFGGKWIDMLEINESCVFTPEEI